MVLDISLKEVNRTMQELIKRLLLNKAVRNNVDLVDLATDSVALGSPWHE